jgi:hypothetical protein
MRSKLKLFSARLDLDKLRLPSTLQIKELRSEPYIDHLGERELRVWAVLDESVTEEQRTGYAISEASAVIRGKLRALGVEEFVYLRFLKRSEMAESGIQI